MLSGGRGGWLLLKTQNRLFVISFCLAGLACLVRGKWLMAEMWACYINKNHLLSVSFLGFYVILYHSVLYDPNLQHLDLHVIMNGKGVYHHFLTGNNTPTLHFYQVRKKDEVMHDHKVKTGCF